MNREIINELICLSHLMHRKLDSSVCGMQEGGLTGKRAAVLNYIVDVHSEREVLQKEIETVFNIRRSTATSLLQDLERYGYVTRENMPDDARREKIVPTEKAEMCHKAVKDSLRDISKKMEEGLTEEEKADFLSVLDKMKDNLNED